MIEAFRELAHNGLAVRGEYGVFPVRFRAANGGLCALGELAHNGLAVRGEYGVFPVPFHAANGGLCAFGEQE